VINGAPMIKRGCDQRTSDQRRADDQIKGHVIIGAPMITWALGLIIGAPMIRAPLITAPSI